MNFNGNILVIGRDPLLFTEGSESIERARRYAQKVGEYHIISFSRRGVRARSYDGKLFVWPTNSYSPLFWIFDAIRLACRIVQTRAITLIDAQDPFESGAVAWIIARMYTLSFRLQVHTDIVSPWYRRASWKERIRYHSARFLVPRADCLRVVSERIRKSLVRVWNIPQERIAVLPIFTDLAAYLGVPHPLPRNGTAPAAISFVSIGRLVDKEKNYSMLIDVMHDLVQVVPNAKFTIIGEGPDRRRLRRLISARGLDRHVILEGWRTDLPTYLSHFDCFLLSSWYEGWGRVVLEAMAAGLAIVMTDVGLAGEVVEDGENGIVVPVGDRKKFFESLLALCRDSSSLMHLRENARKTAIRLNTSNWDLYADAYSALLRSCVQKPEHTR